MMVLNIDSMIPEGHLLRWLKNYVNYDFAYEKAASYSSYVGRRSVGRWFYGKYALDTLYPHML